MAALESTQPTANEFAQNQSKPFVSLSRIHPARFLTIRPGLRHGVCVPLEGVWLEKAGFFDGTMVQVIVSDRRLVIESVPEDNLAGRLIPSKTVTLADQRRLIARLARLGLAGEYDESDECEGDDDA